MLRICNITKEYRKPAIRALSDVSLDIGSGEVVGLLGPNGAGKTTLVKIINNLILPDSGHILIEDRLLKSFREVAGFIGSVFDSERNLYWGLTVRQNLYYFAQLKGIQRTVVSRKMTDLENLLNLRELWNRRVVTLSHGQRQCAAIAAALVHSPRILILDEPTNGLDVENVARLNRIIRELARKQLSIIISSHNLAFIEEVADRVYFITNGKIVGNLKLDGSLNSEGHQFYHLILSDYPSSSQISIIEKSGCRLIGRRKNQLEIELLPSVSLSQVIEEITKIGLVITSVDCSQMSLIKLYHQIVLQKSLMEGESVNEDSSCSNG